MFGSLGLPELLFIFALGLVIFGPKRLPQVGRTVGRGLAEFRKASTDLRRTINAELIDDDLKSAHPGKIVRDTLSDMKKGLDGDFGSSESRSSDKNRSSDENRSAKGARQEGADSAGSETVDSRPSSAEQPQSGAEPDPPIIAARGAVPRGASPSAKQEASKSSEPLGSGKVRSGETGPSSAATDGTAPPAPESSK